MKIFLLAYVATFSEQFISGEATSSHFFRVKRKANFSENQYPSLPTFSGELPFESGHFFKRLYIL